MAQVAFKLNNHSNSGIIAFNPKIVEPEAPKKPNNKKAGSKSEVYPYTIEDMKGMTEYFRDHEMWPHYLLFVMSCNMARRINDMLSLRWINIYYKDGRMRQDILEIVEDKTDKLANPRINSSCRSAIELYIEKTGCDPAKNDYNEYVFTQLSGNFAGRVISDSAHLKALKKAGYALNISYNIGTHSARKTFGMITRQLHPSDYDSMELLQTIYNHSDTKTTNRYIGLTKQRIDQYYDDMGSFFNDYIVGDKEYVPEKNTVVVSFDVNELRDLITAAYQAGIENGNSTDPMCHINAIADLMGKIDEIKK